MKNNRAKWNNDFMPIRSETTELLLGFFEERRPNKKQNKNKVSSDMESATGPETLNF